MPRTSPASTGQATGRTEAQHRLAAILWDHLQASEDSSGKRLPSSGIALGIELVHDALGRPYLLSGGCRRSSVSFSEGGGKLWAALCGEEADVGIDAAASDEFPETYPFHRVFHGDELHHALRSAGGDLGKAAALLWSIKEAVVKAFGCGFHGVDPLHITIHPGVGDHDGRAFLVGLSQKALRRLPEAAARPLWVRAFPQE
ncbi:MAG: 4'-phosphopantetheinyl transferase superfamily protein, partial [Proteobacteria bacterium]|nr:4'-phosphopantetheinyl transferase superfamily protein [Pseudomonadota bacterium]